ncbi:MAG: ArsA family ATPase [Lachnospiraceae bacterium]|nr:ArsA family ATPase [Lachnospiraceae bacterium]
MSKIYIFTGKGGVGKSSIAAAHAIKSALEGERTILVSTDMAHNLGDIFEVNPEKEPLKVMENLDIYEIDPEYVMEHDFQDIASCVSNMLSEVQSNDWSDIGLAPGMEELFSLLKISEMQKEGIYDRIIVDCAPTGETLSLLKFPELLSWYMEKLFPIGKLAIRLLSPISKAAFRIELPNKRAMNDIERLYIKLQELQELFKDRDTTSIRIVTTPEKMVVEETKRNYLYMNLYNYNVDGLYINRVLPRDINNPFFSQWLQIQEKYINQLYESFGMLPIYTIPWYEEELKGQMAINRMAKEVLKESDIFEIKTIHEREVFTKNEKGYLLDVALPGANKKEMDLYQSRTDIVIKLKNFKRNIPLPNILRNYLITSAKLEEGVLRIQFEKGEETDE